MCGRGSGRATAGERGTVLLLVVGVLAMLSVLSIVFATLGRVDRRVTQAAEANADQEDIASAEAARIARIIAADATDIVPIPMRGQNSALLFQRENTDAPTTSPFVYSDPSGSQLPFNPQGGLTSEMVRDRFNIVKDIIEDRPGGFISGDPWLASSEPTYLGYADGTSLLPSTNNPLVFDPGGSWLRRDWKQISNVVPNGRFVNLFALTDADGDGERDPEGNFLAEPGTGQGQLSQFLALFDADGLLDMGNPWIDDQGEPVPAEPNIPAHWTTNQQWLFRPATELNGRGVDDPMHVLYQFADADGDGFLDSRWFEIPGGSGSRDSVRYFAAVRAIDLSAMVNVNVSTSLRRPPSVYNNNEILLSDHAFPLGSAGPVDIDLARLMTQTDTFFDVGFGYESLHRPQDQSVQSGDFSRFDFEARFAQGIAGYVLMQEVLSGSQGVPQDVTIQSADTKDFVTGQDRWQISQQTLDPLFLRSPGFGNQSTAELLERWGVNSRAISPLEAVTDGNTVNSLSASNAQPQFGPLRVTRDTPLERTGRTTPPIDDPDLQPGTNRAYGSVLTDIRRLLTTQSGTVSRRTRPLGVLNRGMNNLPAPATQLIGADLSEWDFGDNRVNIDPNPDTTQTSFSPIRRLISGNPNNEPLDNDRRDLEEEPARSLLLAYWDALIPYGTDFGDTSSEREQELLWNPSVEQFRTLTYGHNPDVALRLAAHMTVNAIDAFDDLDNPTMLTVRFRDNINSNAPDFENTPTTEYPGVQLPSPRNEDDPRLVNSGAVPDAEAEVVNVIGIEAQPFLIEATCMQVYTDAPVGAEGDDEASEYREALDLDHTAGPLDAAPITINADPDEQSNQDFLFEVIAFQITNPFDRPILLTEPGGGVRYYAEYAGRYFPLAPIDQDTGEMAQEDVILFAGQTRVFYATNPGRRADILDRVNDVLEASESDILEDDNLLAIFRAQFGQDSVHTPITESPDTDTNGFPTDYLTTSSDWIELHGTTDDVRDTVYLWRVMRSITDASTQETDRNVGGFENDLLMDRMVLVNADRDRADLFFDAREQTKTELESDEVPDTIALEEDDQQAINDNTGFSVVTWQSVRRPTAESLKIGETFTFGSAMPPWCMEAKLDNALGLSFDSYNRNWDNGNNNSRDIGSREQFRSEASIRESARRPSLSSLLSRISSENLVSGLDARAENKTGNDIEDIHNSLPTSPINMSDRDWVDQTVEIHLSGKSLSITGTDGISENRRNPGMFRRAGDMLLPLAVGPSWIPDHPEAQASDRRERLEAQWTTLSEAIAIAGDYHSPDNPSGVRSNYYKAARPIDEPGYGNRPAVLVRGRLNLDAFAPYLDTNNDQKFDETSGDIRYGNATPLAWNVLDQFESLNALPGEPVPGRVNIATAPASVLRMLPMLTPNAADLNNNKEWWWNDGALDIDTDAAAWISAVRDKTVTRTRDDGTNPRVQIDVREQQIDTMTGARGRSIITGIDGLRETSGLLGRQEILLSPGFDTNGDPLEITDPVFRQGTTFLGFDDDTNDGTDQSNQRLVGIDPVMYAGQTPESIEDDGINDDYDERLTVPNAVINAIDARSDYFAAWILLHGYRRSDVENLADQDPMVPSVQRRFLMVIDRSDVRSAGDDPNIVLFREVPL